MRTLADRIDDGEVPMSEDVNELGMRTFRIVDADLYDELVAALENPLPPSADLRRLLTTKPPWKE